MPDEYANCVRDCFVSEQIPSINWVLDAEDEQLQLMIDEGVQVHEPADRQAFVDAAAQVVEACEAEESVDRRSV